MGGSKASSSDVGFEGFVVSGWIKFFEEWVFREIFVRRWGVGTRIGIFADELLLRGGCISCTEYD